MKNGAISPRSFFLADPRCRFGGHSLGEFPVAGPAELVEIEQFFDPLVGRVESLGRLAGDQPASQRAFSSSISRP